MNSPSNSNATEPKAHLTALSNAMKTAFKDGQEDEMERVRPIIQNALSAFDLIERMVQEQKKRLKALLLSADGALEDKNNGAHD